MKKKTNNAQWADGGGGIGCEQIFSFLAFKLWSDA